MDRTWANTPFVLRLSKHEQAPELHFTRSQASDNPFTAKAQGRTKKVKNRNRLREALRQLASTAY